ncbi:MAG TPA: hypothetical protein VK973_09845, partial [Arenicellales bacterium]|nr:hypothetical protein [Arenicellales bacterium]
MFRPTALLSALLFALPAGPAAADQNAENLEPLFKELARAEYPITAQQVEREIWLTWLDSGDEAVDREL